MNRRSFFAAGAALASGAAAPAISSQFIKSICSVIFPRAMPLDECFRQARNAGFEGVEVRMGNQVTVSSTADDLKRLAGAAEKARITIVSLWVSPALSDNPLNSPDTAVRAKGVEVLHKTIDFAKWLNCGALLIVPGRLGDGAKLKVGYQDTWDRVTAELRKAIAHAAQNKVLLTLENVWNKFLVSPLEMRAFVDQLRSPWLQTHFDIGNVMQFGYPQDWILTLGPRIKRIHVKDYKLSQRAEQGRFVELLEGDVDWKEVMAALVKVGYRGYLSPEIGHRQDDVDQLMKVSRALDKILAMA